jgi:hypothetical protein
VSVIGPTNSSFEFPILKLSSSFTKLLTCIQLLHNPIHSLEQLINYIRTTVNRNS